MSESTSPASLVRAWYERLPKPIRDHPSVDIPNDERELLVELLVEEVDELRQALDANSIVRTADALADIVYVAYGAALQFGFDLDAVLTEVHRANMSKSFSDGRFTLDNDGKVTRGDQYVPPRLNVILGIEKEATEE